MALLNEPIEKFATLKLKQTGNIFDLQSENEMKWKLEHVPMLGVFRSLLALRTDLGSSFWTAPSEVVEFTTSWFCRARMSSSSDVMGELLPSDNSWIWSRKLSNWLSIFLSSRMKNTSVTNWKLLSMKLKSLLDMTMDSPKVDDTSK